MSRGFAVLVVPMISVAAAAATPARAQEPKGACALAAQYQVMELPGLGGPVVGALGLDESGQAAGWSLDSSWRSRAVAWNGRRAASLSSGEGSAQGLSSDGRVAGWQRTSAGVRATVWWDGTVRHHAPLSGHIASWAADVNRAGLVVGWSVNSNGNTTAAAWDSGRVRNLGSAGPRPQVSWALAVNDAGVIVGRGEFSSGAPRRALMWSGSTTTVLPGLGGGVDGATSISPAGVVSGGSRSAQTSKFHGVLWRNGQVQDLGLLQGFHETVAYGVNDCGLAVGDSIVDLFTGRTVAVGWSGGQARELGSLLPPGSGWTLTTARAVNSRGQILGYGLRSGAWGQRAFLLTPLP
jgi:probable HAF family extracellular repeat protein